VKPELVGRTALVTGATRGIGRACADLLHAHDVRVYAAGRRQIDDARPYETVQLDVTDAAQVDAFMESTPDPIQILVNNAGMSGVVDYAALEIDLAVWRETFAVNVEGTFNCARAVARRLVHERMPGAIVNISSIAGKRGFPGSAHYCASKASVLGFTRGAALDLAPEGITVNAICPGTVDTDMMDELIVSLAKAEGIEPDAVRQRLVADLPQGRMQTAGEVAASVLFLASTGARAITGEALVIDGGATRD